MGTAFNNHSTDYNKINRVYDTGRAANVKTLEKLVPFEIEFRCHFNSPDDAYGALPFLRSCLQQRVTWNGTFYGQELFQSGQLLRTAEIYEKDNEGFYLTWKGQDIGKFANIQPEIVEDITTCITNSTILTLLGGGKNIQNKNEVIQVLERLGHYRFMSWSGVDIFGFYEPYNVSVKLMSCEILRYPLLVEIEKTATNEEEAYQCESELEELCRQFQLKEYLVREEPPLLLYIGIFGS